MLPLKNLHLKCFISVFGSNSLINLIVNIKFIRTSEKIQQDSTFLNHPVRICFQKEENNKVHIGVDEVGALMVLGSGWLQCITFNVSLFVCVYGSSHEFHKSGCWASSFLEHSEKMIHQSRLLPGIVVSLRLISWWLSCLHNPQLWLPNSMFWVLQIQTRTNTFL